MKAKIATLTIAAMISVPAFAQENQAQNFEQQVFTTQTTVKAVELSQAEMRETEGSLLHVPIILPILIGGNIGAWGNHYDSYQETGQPASVHSTLKATGMGMATGATIPGGRYAVTATSRVIGPTKNWVRIGDSYSKTQGVKTFGIRWGTNNHYAKQIPNQTARDLNKALRNTKLPGSNWRVQDKGHLHFWKKSK